MKPHRFHCDTCGCSLYMLGELDVNECFACSDWLKRSIVYLVRKARRSA